MLLLSFNLMFFIFSAKFLTSKVANICGSRYNNASDFSRKWQFELELVNLIWDHSMDRARARLKPAMSNLDDFHIPRRKVPGPNVVLDADGYDYANVRVANGFVGVRYQLFQRLHQSLWPSILLAGVLGTQVVVIWANSTKWTTQSEARSWILVSLELSRLKEELDKWFLTSRFRWLCMELRLCP